ncbi:MAG: hypothetical protein CV045_07920 [Cyanobacteria bacterium M5B4]|nr:hypothetical protein [Cyanobacteria bacterium KgW148]PLS68426.1 MAG: hypothetical protein CV045_07920 [Cyanobacteria bacterium M5B4]
MKDASIIHLEYQGITTKVSVQTPLPMVPKPKLVYRTPAGRVSSLPILKGINSTIDPKTLQPQDLIDSDPELDWRSGGEILEMDMLTTAYFDPNDNDRRPVSDFQVFDIIYDAQGNAIDRRPKLNRKANINTPIPVKLGKRLPLLQVLTTFVLRHTYQLVHEDGVTREFLYRIAQDLHHKQEMAIVGAGVKGNQPIVMRDKGSPYRGFLYGEIGKDQQQEQYKLLLLLSDQELKLADKDKDDDRSE